MKELFRNLWRRYKYQKQGIVDVGNHDKEPRNSGSGERGKTYESGKMGESHVRWTYENGAGSACQGCLCPGSGAEQERARLSTLIARMDAAGEGDQVARLQDPEFIQEMLKKYDL